MPKSGDYEFDWARGQMRPDVDRRNTVPKPVASHAVGTSPMPAGPKPMSKRVKSAAEIAEGDPSGGPRPLTKGLFLSRGNIQPDSRDIELKPARPVRRSLRGRR